MTQDLSDHYQLMTYLEFNKLSTVTLNKKMLDDGMKNTQDRGGEARYHQQNYHEAEQYSGEEYEYEV